MRMMLLFILLFVTGFSIASSNGLSNLSSNVYEAESLQEKPFYEDHARGWHWYEAGMIPAPDDKKTEQDSKTRDFSNNPVDNISPGGAASYPATEELKKYQAQLEESKALAVMHPTPQNVFNYQRLQYEMAEKSGKFAEVWMQNVYTNPNLDYTQRSPVSQNARHIYLVEQRKQTESKIQKLSQEYGLFFFFKNDCPYCDAFAPVVKSFSQKYNWDVLAISAIGDHVSEFGETHRLRSVQDNGLAETWGVNTYPSLFAVNPKSGHVIPVAVGMISIQEIEERIIAIAGAGSHGGDND